MSEDGKRAVLSYDRAFVDLVRTEGWKLYVKILDEQLRLRLSLLEQPIHDLPVQPGEPRPDFVSRAAQMESIKGTVIGLRLARSLVTSTMAHADEIRREARERGGAKQETEDADA